MNFAWTSAGSSPAAVVVNGAQTATSANCNDAGGNAWAASVKEKVPSTTVDTFMIVV